MMIIGGKVMKRKSLLIATILTIMLCVIVISGCTSSSPSAQPTANAPASATVPASAPGNAPSGPPKATTSGETMTITGSQGGEFTMTMEKASYLVSVQSQNGLVQMKTPMGGVDLDLIPYNAATPGASGMYEQQFIYDWVKAGSGSFKINFVGDKAAPYTITWTKLPTSTAAAVSAPQKYTGNGQKVLGPVKLSAGMATFTISCPDTKKAGFDIKLFNADTGDYIGMIGYNAESGSVQNSYSAAKSQNIAAAGNYYVQVTANSDANWEVGVSQ